MSHFDLPRYLRKFAPAIVLGDREVILQCPACGKQKLSVNLQKEVWHCWVCEQYHRDQYGRRKVVQGAGGVISLVALLEGCSRVRAREIVGDASEQAHVPLEGISGVQIRDQHWGHDLAEVDPPEGWLAITDYRAFPYLAQRGILSEDITNYGLGVCLSGKYANRLIFPVWANRRLVYWQARAMFNDLHPGTRKALNPTGVYAGNVLFNLDQAAKHSRVIITEGPIDAIHAGHSAVCTFGEKISDKQILQLHRAGVRAVDLMWDGPGPTEPMGAWPEMIEAGKRLAGVFDVRLVFFAEGRSGGISPGYAEKIL